MPDLHGAVGTGCGEALVIDEPRYSSLETNVGDLVMNVIRCIAIGTLILLAGSGSRADLVLDYSFDTITDNFFGTNATA
jgi:hypothetical protein